MSQAILPPWKKNQWGSLLGLNFSDSYKELHFTFSQFFYSMCGVANANDSKWVFFLVFCFVSRYSVFFDLLLQCEIMDLFMPKGILKDILACLN